MIDKVSDSMELPLTAEPQGSLWCARVQRAERFALALHCDDGDRISAGATTSPCGSAPLDGTPT
jgi:hypothetical protein